MANFTESQLIQKPDFQPMSETTALNEFSVEMLKSLEVAVDLAMLQLGNNKIRNDYLPRWKVIIRDAIKDASFEETKR